MQTSSALQSALSTAASNGATDEIQIVQGTYTGNFTHETQEEYKLTVKGGYTSGCTSRVVNASNTVLDGNSAGTVLMGDNGERADFECEGVTFQNGSAARGGGLRIDSEAGNVTLSITGFPVIVRPSLVVESMLLQTQQSPLPTTPSVTTIATTIRAAPAIGSATGTGTLVLTANTIKGNTAGGAVGGLMTWCNSVSVTNNLFHNNSAPWYHGALLIDGSASTRVINNTITGNTSEGRGAGLTIQMGEDSDRADVYNNIIYNNTGYWEANDLAIFNDQDENGVASPVSLLNNDFDQSSTGTFIAIPFTIDPSNLNHQNPLFVGSATGGYRLAKGSPCIDTGTSTDAPATDMAGTSRPRGQGYDMGAYEYVGVPVPDIKANSQEGSITVSSGTPVSITLSLDPDNLSGQNVDWWVVELTPSSTYNHFDLSTGSMVQGLSPTHQGPLFNLGTTQLLNSSNLAVGTHTFYFAVDLNMNGELDMNSIYYDSVGINVTAP